MAQACNVPIHRLNNFSLVEILSTICDYFAETILLPTDHLNPTATFPPTKHTHDDRRDLQSLRLTCRSLHDAATPKLFQVLEIEFNQKCLSDAEELSRSPRIAPVINGVRVVLRYCPAPVAATLNSFQSAKDKYLSSIEAKLFRQLQKDGRNKKIKRALDAYSTIRFVWEGSRVQGELTEKLDYYEEIGTRAHMSFKTRQEEQKRLVHDGTFATTIGAIFSRLPNARSLNVADNYTRRSLQREIYQNNEIQWLIEEDNIVDILASDMRWKWVDEMEELDDIMPAKLLTTIPLEILKHGVELREFQVDVFPEKKDSHWSQQSRISVSLLAHFSHFDLATLG